jgi:hypothetical protein
LRPLSYVVCALLAIVSLTYFPAIACEDASHESAKVAACEVAPEGETDTVSICETQVTEDRSSLDSLKSMLRAGRAVGKAVVTTAVVVTSSMARAARLAAAALVVTAYSLV